MKTAYFHENLIAPCGANCMLCMGYLRSTKPCPGCREGDANKPAACSACRIKNCAELTGKGLRFCYACSKYPCRLIRHLDERYRKNYSYSMISNLETIGERGMAHFLEQEKAGWICPDCSGIICVHRGFCTECGRVFYHHAGTGRARIK